MILGQSIAYWVTIILAGAIITTGGSIWIGSTAPRWSEAFLARDRGPLRLLPGDSVRRYERLGAVFYKKFFPEGGAWAGGEAKRTLPDLTNPDAVRHYIRNARRAEWVHWLSLLTWLPLPFFQPAWLALFCLTAMVIANGMAIIILRYNRVRLYDVLDDLGAAREG